MFAPEGYGIIGASIVVSLLVAATALVLPGPWKWLPVVLAISVIAFTLYFFRDPDRVPPESALDGKVVLAPADGKVVLVDSVEHEPLYIDAPAKQVSIFLSPLNVHVNRSPADGVVEFDQYVPGDYLVAWHPKASEKNERSQLGIRHPSGIRILFKQIAGKVARRIVYHVTVGDTLEAGQRFGIVKFGSRMDILMPMSVDVTVRPGDRVTAGESIIAEISVEAPLAIDGAPDTSTVMGADGE